ncbi:MAG: hypothetical protein ACRDQA_02915 [Nocardioidaceae bacterium]
MNHIEIPLPKGYVALVDLADAEAVQQHKWYAAAAGGRTIYAQRAVRREGGGWTTERLHQFLTGFPSTDHRNGDGLDNRRANLRDATQGQNTFNQQRRIGASGFKGATRWKRDGTWKAQISCAGTNHHLGYFPTALEAVLAYDEAARHFHGEFATVNFPKPGERSARKAA